MTLHFSDALKFESIEAIAKKYQFGRYDYVEKFIMDFEMQYQILQKLDCVTRGGMCIPFHTVEHNANRLSIDIDLLTKSSISDVGKIMTEINNSLNEVEIELMVPKKPYPIANLCSYRVYYTSFSGEKDWIKVDYLCNMDIDLPIKTVPSNYELFALTTDYEIKILTRGGLIADKLTTLSLNTIGLPERKFGEIPKQVFDIGSQIRLISKEDAIEIFKIFKKFTDFKIRIFDRSPKYTITEIINGIENSLLKFFEFDKTAVHLTKDQDDKFSNFMGTYLGNHIYRRTEHLGNILLVLTLIKKIKEYLSTPEKLDTLSENFLDIINKINSYKTIDVPEIRIESQQLLSQQLPKFIEPHKKMLKGQPLEYIYLLKEVYF